MARTGLAQLREVLRGMTQAGTADYSIGTANYWDDSHLDEVLDRHREDFRFEPLESYPTVGVGGTSLFYEFEVEDRENLEQTTGGTTVFYLQDSTGEFVGTAIYSVDYLRGKVTFTQDTRGTVYYATGRSYDLNAAAADIWRKKAGYYYTAFNFSTDNHKIDREKIYQHCIEMAESFEAMSEDSVTTVDMWRSDTDAV